MRIIKEASAGNTKRKQCTMFQFGNTMIQREGVHSLARATMALAITIRVSILRNGITHQDGNGYPSVSKTVNTERVEPVGRETY